MESNMPDDEDVRNAANHVPAPFLSGVLLAERREEAGEDHDEIGNNGHESVCTVNPGKQAEVEQQERRGDGPVDVPSVEDLATVQVMRARQFAMVVLDLDTAVAGGMARCHREIGERRGDGDESCDDVIETAGHGHVPGHGRESNRGENHDNKHDPEGREAIVPGMLILGRRRCSC